ncbi:FecR family protein [Sphingobacterium thalpophilum]|uniref:FecR family protein n=1 Tax=Sphingobacterium thalpophilum TaxID=259 RepID=A0ACD5C3H0_9SPHI
MSNQKYTSQEIDQFLANQCTAEEAKSIARYLEENTEELDKIEIFEHLVEEEMIVIAADQKELFLGTLIQPNKIVPLWRKYLAVASLIAVFLTSVFLIYRLQNDSVPIKSKDEINYVEIANQSLQDTLIILPDHSRILMNPKSKLRYPFDFKTNRSIRQLAGSILYKVAKDSVHPFRVNLDDIVTQAVGTEFWVSKQHNEIAITLLEGRVKLNSLDPYYELKDLYLEPGQICKIDKNNRKLNIAQLVTTHHTASVPNRSQRPYFGQGLEGVTWSTDEVVFDQVQLNRLIGQLEQQYHVKINVDGVNLQKQSFTGRVFVTDSLETLLQAICEINNLDYSIKNKTYYIKPKSKNK